MTTFSLASYQPVAFHAYPELMRARRAASPDSTPTVRRPAVPGPVAAPPLAQDAARPLAEHVGVTVLGFGATALLRAGLSAFLDGAGRRCDVRVSVGVAGAHDVNWVLRDVVPFQVRALPRYPADGAAVYGTSVPVAPPEAEPSEHRLLVVVWGTEPRPLTWAAGLCPDLVVQCLDWVVEPAHLRVLAGADRQVVLSRTAPGSRPDLLAHCGRLLSGWAAFQDVPRGLVLTSLDGQGP